MQNLTVITNNETQIDSRQIAEWTGKEHQHVLRDIRNEIEELGELGLTIFGQSSYTNSQNKQQPCYKMNRDGVMQLALKYDAVVRYKVIQKLNELEQANKAKLPQSFAEALRLAADLEEQKQKLLPKAESFDKFISGENYQDMTTVAKVLNWGRNKLFLTLRDKEIFRYNNTPYQSYIDRGYFVVKEKPIEMNGQIINKPQTYCTSKGVEYLHRILN
jgi:Rha family phage regulatory protein